MKYLSFLLTLGILTLALYSCDELEDDIGDDLGACGTLTLNDLSNIDAIDEEHLMI